MARNPAGERPLGPVDPGDVRALAQVVEAGSFTRAAEVLGVSKSRVSRAVARLEARLGVRLLSRSTRSLILTEEGRAYLDAALPALDALEEAGRVVASARAEPRGLLRIALPLSFGLRYLAPELLAFAARWPDLEVDLRLSDHPVDLLAEGFDLAVRGGILPDSSLVGRRLCGFDLKVVASPDYLSRAGRPAHPRELESHACLRYAASRTLPEWWFRGPDGEVVVPRVRARLAADSGDLLVQAAVAGLGIASLPAFQVHEALRAGRLLTLFDDWERLRGAFFAVVPHRRYLPARVRLCIDHLAARLAHPPWEA